MHDLVIRGGTVVDGTGCSPYIADIAIDQDRIVAVGTVSEAGRRQVDAAGLIVTPGWVDIHTHYDGQATWDPELSPSSWHGVTTVVMGNCGVGFAPVRPTSREWLIQLMEGVEDIPGTALAEGMTWNWESFPEYLDELARMPRVVDVAALVPHGALRAYVLGESGANAPANGTDIEQMVSLVRQAVSAGAVGVSTTRTGGHRAKDGELAAGTTAEAKELLALGGALSDAGHRVFSVVSDMRDLDYEMRWMRGISRRARIPVTYQVLQLNEAPELWRTLIDCGVAANRTGGWLVPQVAGKPTSVLVGFESTVHPFAKYPSYQAIAELPYPERLARLRSRGTREAILAERVAPASSIEAMLNGGLDRLFPLGNPPNYEPAAEESIAAIAARTLQDPLEVAYDLMLEQAGHQLLYRPIFGYAHGDLDAIGEMLNHPATVLGLGDGGAHCGLICDASLPTFMLTHWVRDRARGRRLRLEQVVAMQTRRTAQLYGFMDRGCLAPGFLADVNVIDLNGLGLEPPEMTYDLPAGGKRLIQRARGYHMTIKSGVVVRENDEATGDRPGRVLRGPQPSPH